MKIEKIERSHHKQERILVFLEGGDLLRITESELLHFGLRAGEEIDASALAALRRESARSEARRMAAELVGARPISRHDLAGKLIAKGASPEDAEDACDWLCGIGALDDTAYAAMLVRHYSAAGYGMLRLREELHRRGVPRELWDGALQTAPDPQQTIAGVIAARGKNRALDERERRKLSDALLRRGFSWGEVKEALQKLGGEAEDGACC